MQRITPHRTWHPWRSAAAALLCCLGFLIVTGQARAETRAVHLELLLAVDTSLSVSDEEFALQSLGFANAFRDQRIGQAIEALGNRGIAVALVQWGNTDQHSLAVDWVLVTDGASSRALARRIAAMPRLFVGPGTAIAAALDFSAALFPRNGFDGDRRVIDVSGDGVDNRLRVPRSSRDRTVAQGITVNGLAILNEDPHLDHYYRHNVIGGDGAFVMTAADYEDFAEAILRKLLREISGAPVANAPPAGRTAALKETSTKP